MKDTLRQINEKINIYILAGLVGAISFILVYGIDVLNISYVDWIKNAGGDLEQSYYGWCFFRRSKWYFPIGLMEGVSYPELTSIIYIDSVPLFNIIFKLLRDFLPAEAQFFGIWGVTCFVLSGMISAAIMYKITGNRWYSLFCSLFFVFNNVVMQRLYTHTALAANWLILLCIYLAITLADKDKIKLDDILKWGGIFSLAVSVNIYYLPILGLIMFGFVVYRFFGHKEIKKGILSITSSLCGTFLMFYILGGMHNLDAGDAAPAGLGHYSANLNSLFNPMETGKYLSGFSLLFKSLPLATDGQYEGYAYLGAGLILLVLFELVKLIADGELRKWFFENRTKVLVTFGIILCLIIASVGTTVSFCDKSFFSIPYPDLILKVYSIFRSTGRFMWGVWNIVAIGVLFVLWKCKPTKEIPLVLILCLLVQLVDFQPMIQNRHNIYSEKQVYYPSKALKEDWSETFSDKTNMVLLNSNMLNLERFYDIAQLALNSGLNINDFYYSRRSNESIERYKAEQWKSIESNKVASDIVYVFDTFDSIIGVTSKLNIYYKGGMIIGTADAISGENIVEAEDITADGLKTENSRLIYEVKEDDVYAVEISGQNALNSKVMLNGEELRLETIYDGNTLIQVVVNAKKGDKIEVITEEGENSFRLIQCKTVAM